MMFLPAAGISFLGDSPVLVKQRALLGREIIALAVPEEIAST